MVRKYIPEPIKKLYRLIRAKLLSIGLTRCGVFNQPEDEVEASKYISVIVAIHDSPELTRRCLESIEKYSANAEIIMVDDASQLQETVDLIRDYEQRNSWIVVRHNEALGHSRSCEAGSRFATRPYLCFLNSDTVVTPRCWRGAKESFDSDPRIAVTGPTTSRASTKQTVRRADYCRHYWTDSQICAFAERYISKQQPRSWVDLPAVDGFAFFIRHKIWEKFGGFDNKLPDYGNESELCRRLSEKGFRIVWTQNSYIHHFGEATYGRFMSTNEIRQKRITARDYIKSVYNRE